MKRVGSDMHVKGSDMIWYMLVKPLPYVLPKAVNDAFNLISKQGDYKIGT